MKTKRGWQKGQLDWFVILFSFRLHLEYCSNCITVSLAEVFDWHSRKVLTQHFPLSSLHRSIHFRLHKSYRFVVNFFQDGTRRRQQTRYPSIHYAISLLHFAAGIYYKLHCIRHLAADRMRPTLYGVKVKVAGSRSLWVFSICRFRRRWRTRHFCITLITSKL